MSSTIDKLFAILRRDLLTAIRHRSGFVVTLSESYGTGGVLLSFARHRARVSSGWRRLLSLSFWSAPASTHFS